jgi:hypothetical protein
MLDNALRAQLVNEAMRLGDALLSRAQSQPYGLSWPTMATDPLEKTRLVWQTSDSLYSGVAGIALFFLELSQHVPEARYIDAATAGMRWVEHYCRQTPAASYGFINGRVGVAYALARAAAVTRVSCFRDQALHLVRPVASALRSPALAADVLSGTAGIVLGLLHLYDASGAPWLLELLDLGMQRLIEQTCVAPHGVYWDRSPQLIRGLCGLSHGAAGIGWVLLAVGQYFHNAACLWLAEQAFAYEAAHYNAVQQNWPDFRKGIYEPADYTQHYAAYRAGDEAFFTTGGDMNAWCHGAAGIGLTRLRAYEVCQKAGYKQDVENAIAKTRRTDVDTASPLASCSLCHGCAGNAELFLEAHRLWPEARYLALAAQVASKMLDFQHAHGWYPSGYRHLQAQEDTSLFLGNAGIGYFYLRLLDPDRTPSILAPWVTARVRPPEALAAYRFLTLTLGDLQHLLLSKIFPRTLVVMGQQCPAHVWEDGTPATGSAPLHERVLAAALAVGAVLPPAVQERLVDVAHLEHAQGCLEATRGSDTWLSLREGVHAEQAQALLTLDTEALCAQHLILDPHATIRMQRWAWPHAVPQYWQQNFATEPGQHPVLLRPTWRGVVETPLSTLSYAILTAFQHGACVAQVLSDIAASIEPPVSPAQAMAVQESILEQIRAAFAAGILIMVEEWVPCVRFSGHRLWPS